MEKVKIENVKKGEFVRRKLDAKTTFTKQGYCRFEKKYQLDDYEDINRCIYLTKGTDVYVGFDY
jgi:hypothetical protein|tara:strand:+ start:86 stop:277 length:192 start_codon:yes stop_codon:yes gene_type:complete